MIQVTGTLVATALSELEALEFAGLLDQAVANPDTSVHSYSRDGLSLTVQVGFSMPMPSSVS